MYPIIHYRDEAASFNSHKWVIPCQISKELLEPPQISTKLGVFGVYTYGASKTFDRIPHYRLCNKIMLSWK